MSASAFLGALAAVLLAAAFTGVLATVLVMRLLQGRRDRREAGRRAVARHPARRQPPRGRPGLPVDGRPLTRAELREFTGIMMRSTTRDQGRRP